MKTAIVGIILSILGGACAQLFMKSGMLGLSEVPLAEYAATLFNAPERFVTIALGILFYVCAVFTWMLALRHFELNAIYPLLALGYAVVYIAAAHWPGIEETYSTQKTAGVMLIITGVVMASHNNGSESA